MTACRVLYLTKDSFDVTVVKYST